MTYKKLKFSAVSFAAFCGVLLLLNTLAYGQNKVVKFGSLTINNGLSQSTVKCILKDRVGFMWFSTDDGLNRYDGYNFTVYRHDAKDKHSLPSNTITVIMEDKAGNLWIGSSGGLSLYNRNSDTFTTLTANRNNDYTLSSDDVNAILQDSKDNIWVGTYSGLNLLDIKTKTFTRFLYTKNRDDIAAHHVFSMAEDDDGSLWLGTGVGLVQFNYNTGSTINYPDGANSTPINTLIKNENGGLYVGTKGNGLAVFNTKSHTFKNFVHQANKPNCLINNDVLAFAPAGDKKVWVGTEDGLDIFDEDKASFTHYISNDRFNTSENNSINFILNSGGILWLGTYESGVRYYDSNLSSFDYFYKSQSGPNGLSNDIVTSFAEETGKGYWIGTDGGGLNFLDKETQLFTHYPATPHKNAVSGNHILRLLEDRQQNLWIGYYEAGLDMVNSRTQKFTHYAVGNKPNEINGDIVFGLAEDKNNDIWVGMDDAGVNVIHQSKIIKRYNYNPLDTAHCLTNNDVRTIYKDREGNMWIGTFAGLNLYNAAADNFTHFKTFNSGLTNNIVLSVFEDDNGNIWAGTLGGGLNLYNRAKKTFTSYTFPGGLTYSIINSITEDDKGFIWVGTNRGLISFKPNTSKFSNYNASNNLQGYEFFMGAVLKNHDGQLLFGGHSGFNIIDPDHLATNKHNHAVVFTDFQLFNKKVPVGENSVLKKSITQTKVIRLNYSQSVFTIEYSALNFTLPNTPFIGVLISWLIVARKTLLALFALSASFRAFNSCSFCFISLSFISCR